MDYFRLILYKSLSLNSIINEIVGLLKTDMGVLRFSFDAGSWFYRLSQQLVVKANNASHVRINIVSVNLLDNASTHDKVVNGFRTISCY